MLNNNRKITRQEENGTLGYEIGMFRESSKALLSGIKLADFYHNLVVESFVIHARVLIDFFYGKRQHPDDMIAKDFFSEDVDWVNIRPPLTRVLQEAKTKANKQLAHLSFTRLKLKSKNEKGWKIFEIFNDMNKVINSFNKAKNK